MSNDEVAKAQDQLDNNAGQSAPTPTALQVSDAEAAAVQKTPNRVTLESIEAKIEFVEYINPTSAPHVTLAFVKLKNGFVLTGLSAPADTENFNAELGKKFSYEKAVRQVWEHEGYLLCEKLAA